MPSDSTSAGPTSRPRPPPAGPTSRPFELWKHPERLADELAELAEDLPANPPVGVTMTGELCDCFPTKRDGVRHILAAVGEAFEPARVRVWSTAGALLTLDDARTAVTMAVAAANWHALATYAGRFAPDGRRTADRHRVDDDRHHPAPRGQPIPVGLTDPERLRSGELVYTGVRRTPICARFWGSAVAAELFATTHDVYAALG